MEVAALCVACVRMQPASNVLAAYLGHPTLQVCRDCIRAPSPIDVTRDDTVDVPWPMSPRIERRREPVSPKHQARSAVSRAVAKGALVRPATCQMCGLPPTATS